jgi:hypothetical protein
MLEHETGEVRIKKRMAECAGGLRIDQESLKRIGLSAVSWGYIMQCTRLVLVNLLSIYTFNQFRRINYPRDAALAQI